MEINYLNQNHCLANPSQYSKSSRNSKSKSRSKSKNQSKSERFDSNDNDYHPVIIKGRTKTAQEIVSFVSELKENKPKIKTAELVGDYSSGFGRQLIGIPPNISVKLRYTSTYSHTHTTGTMQSWAFRGNSVYDPDYTYTGHQPVGFDELAAFYDYYRVTASHIEVFSSSLTANVPIAVVVFPSRALSGQSDYVASLESTRSAYHIIATNSVPTTIIKNTATTKSLFSGQDVTDQDFGAACTTNPNKPWSWTVTTNSANGASTSSVALTVVISFDVIFSQKDLLNTS
jgi:hypothetical protein